MKYMITFNHVDGAWEELSEEAVQSHQTWLTNFMADLKREKNADLVFCGPVDSRITVRKHVSGDIEVSDGPALTTSEHVGGYYLIDAETRDEAVEWARRGRWLVGSNEVIPIFGELG